MLKKMAIFLGALILTLLVAAWFAIYYFEAFDVGHKSVASYIIVPASIRKTPLVDVCEDPKFNWKGRDGESPQYISLVYGTLRSPTELIEYHRGSFEKTQCRSNPLITLSGGARMMFDCDHGDFRSIELSIEESQNNCKTVKITFLEN